MEAKWREQEKGFVFILLPKWTYVTELDNVLCKDYILLQSVKLRISD